VPIIIGMFNAKYWLNEKKGTEENIPFITSFCVCIISILIQNSTLVLYFFHPHKKWLLALIKLIENVSDFFYDYDDEGYLFQLQSYYSQQDLLRGVPQNRENIYRKQVHHQNVINNVEIDLFLHWHTWFFPLLIKHIA
jgi:hypothetical protein